MGNDTAEQNPDFGRDYRKELWIAVAAAYAGASNSQYQSRAAARGNAALDAFDERFKGK